MIFLAPTNCEGMKGLDLAFLIDRTKSIKVPNFQLLKGFVLQIIESLTIGPDATQTAFILFAKQATVLNTFNDSRYHSKEEVVHLVRSIPEDLESGTYIDRALIAANNTLFTDAGGDRPGHPNVLVLFTDGKTNIKSENFSTITPSLQVSKINEVL